MEIKTITIKHGEVIFLIDDECYEKIKGWECRCVENGSGQKYLQITKVEGPIRMTSYIHRFLLNCPADKVVDHINGNTRDNRLCNLRIASHQQNVWNRTKTTTKKCHSKYLGVTWVKAVSKWQACIGNLYLGRFDSEEMAAKAYDTAARKLYKEFAKLNFPNSTEEVSIVIRQKKSSKYKGVILDKKTNKWLVAVSINKKRYTGGKLFLTELEAAKAYNNLLIKYNGNKKRLIKLEDIRQVTLDT